MLGVSRHDRARCDRLESRKARARLYSPKRTASKFSRQSESERERETARRKTEKAKKLDAFQKRNLEVQDEQRRRENNCFERIYPPQNVIRAVGGDGDSSATAAASIGEDVPKPTTTNRDTSGGLGRRAATTTGHLKKDYAKFLAVAKHMCHMIATDR